MSNEPTSDNPLPADRNEMAEADNSEALLAELDTLLERMMALPVNPTEDGPSEEPIHREAPPEDIAVITVTEAVAHNLAPVNESPISTSDDDLYVQEILHPRHEEPEPSRPPDPVAFWNAQQPELPEPVHPDLADFIPAPAPRSIPAPVQEQDTGDAPPAFWAMPLVWCNRGFDVLTIPLGPAGGWMRHPLGRTFLGWTGACMLLAVVGLALGDCLGWTW